MEHRLVAIRDDEPLPTWWWAMNGLLFVGMVAFGILRMQDGETFTSAMFPVYVVVSLAGIPPLSREWKRYRTGR